MDQLIEFGLFAGKLVIIVVAIGAVIAMIAGAALKSKQSDQLEVEHLNKKVDNFSQMVKAFLLDKKELKSEKKRKKKEKKLKKKDELKKRAFVIEFEGDIKASAVEQLRDEITAFLSVADQDDEAIVILNSPGGMVHTYGLAASQLLRIKSKGHLLTICVDKVAASGGYLMACTGDRILAAPFAILGSIGVLAQIPNLHRLLKKHDVDYQEITAGEYKRTLTMLGEITEKGKQKFTEQIQDTHNLFKEFVSHQRSQLDLEKVGTGEYWFGQRALDLKLIDEIKTSDEYLFDLRETKELYKLKISPKKKLADKLSEAMSAAAERGADRVWERLSQSPPF